MSGIIFLVAMAWVALIIFLDWAIGFWFGRPNEEFEE